MCVGGAPPPFKRFTYLRNLDDALYKSHEEETNERQMTKINLIIINRHHAEREFT